MSDYRLTAQSAKMGARRREHGPMPQHQSPDTNNDAALDQALDWMIRLDDADAACRARFAEWLAASPDNAAAFERARNCWHSPLLTTAAAQLEQAHRPAARPKPRMRKLLAVAASLLLVAGITLQSDLLLRLKADHVTAVGQRQNLQLVDGSRVLLNTDTALSSHIDERQRVAHLLKGEAYFDIARDTNRPFEITAGPMQIAVRGTAFAVRYLGNEAEVSVEHGEVEVLARGNDTRVYLGSGDSLRIGADGVGRRISNATTSQLAWVKGRLVFDDRPLREVLDELRRYYPGWIISNNPRLDELRITGNYRLSEPETVMRSLAQVTAAELHEYPSLLILN